MAYLRREEGDNVDGSKSGSIATVWEFARAVALKQYAVMNGVMLSNCRTLAEVVACSSHHPTNVKGEPKLYLSAYKVPNQYSSSPAALSALSQRKLTPADKISVNDRVFYIAVDLLHVYTWPCRVLPMIPSWLACR